MSYNQCAIVKYLVVLCQDFSAQSLHLTTLNADAVFTYEKGPVVAGIFLAFAAAMHLAELSRSKAAAQTSSSLT
jgi:hypothetical protein